MEMTKIADMTLHYRGQSDAPPTGKLGRYLGDGDGTVDGEALRGRVVWSLFENQGAMACDASMIGRIETDEGAVIRFETLGFFQREADTQIWLLTAAIRFTTEHERYADFDGRTGWLTGQFDMQSYVHHYNLYLGTDEAARLARSQNGESHAAAD